MGTCHTPFPIKLTEGNLPERKLNVNLMYKSLREKIKKASSRGDSKPPKFPVQAYLKSGNIRSDFQRCKEIVGENLKLIAKINTIQRTHGFTNNYNPKLDGYRKSRHGLTWSRIDKYERENLELAKICLCPQGRLPTRDQLLEQWNKTLKDIHNSVTKPIVLKELMEQNLIREISTNPLRPLVYFNLKQKNDERPLGRLEIVLFYDIVPKIVLNFIALCENSKFQTSDNKKNLKAQPSFLGCSFYRIFPGLYLECGDILYENGCGGMAADGIDFLPDNFDVSHHCRGTLAMIPNADGKINSRFTISFKPLNILNGKRAAFGRVLKGLCFLKAIQSNGTKNGKPKRKVVVSGCGLLNRPQ